jgi:hypothetical protein
MRSDLCLRGWLQGACRGPTARPKMAGMAGSLTGPKALPQARGPSWTVSRRRSRFGQSGNTHRSARYVRRRCRALVLALRRAPLRGCLGFYQGLDRGYSVTLLCRTGRPRPLRTLTVWSEQGKLPKSAGAAGEKRPVARSLRRSKGRCRCRSRSASRKRHDLLGLRSEHANQSPVCEDPSILNGKESRDALAAPPEDR